MFGASSMHPNGLYPIEINRNKSSEGTAVAYTRTQHHPASVYYLICSGLSRQYTSRDVTDEPLPGVDTSASEYRLQGLCNPFQTDIYCIGNLVRQEFMEVSPASTISVYGFRLICFTRDALVSRSWRISLNG